jgi:cytochrome c
VLAAGAFGFNFLAVLGFAADAGYGIGRTPSAAEIAGWDIDVRPDRQGLPPGKGSVAHGRELYDQKCAVCHGSFGESNAYAVLAGGQGTLASPERLKTVGSYWPYATTLWDYIYRAMPFGAPKTLTVDQTYALTAYVLHLNDLLGANAVLDEQLLPQIKMPNRDGFSSGDSLPDVKSSRCMKDCQAAPGVKVVALSEAALKVAAPTGQIEAPQGAAAPAAVAAGTDSRSDPQALATKTGCMACHGVDKAIVGPAFKEIAVKYKGDPGTEAKLAEKVQKGGSGVWGSTPMPPNPQLKREEIGRLIKWVLRQ